MGIWLIVIVMMSFLLGSGVTAAGVWLGGYIRRDTVQAVAIENAKTAEAAKGEVVTLPDLMGNDRGEVISLDDDRVRGSIFDDLVKQNNRLNSQLAKGMVPATDGSD